MTGIHCDHCGDNCGDDHRGGNTFPQVWHTDHEGTWWRTYSCPFCHVGAA